MITKFKIYEQADVDKPKVGDYVICSENIKDDDEYNIFLSQNIGRIVGKDTGAYDFTISYDDVPENKLHYFGSMGNNNLCRPMSIEEIIHWSKNKEDLEPFIKSNKYNL